MPNRRNLLKGIGAAGGVIAGIAGTGVAAANGTQSPAYTPRRRVMLLVDRSSSMWPQRQATVDGINAYVDGLRDTPNLEIALFQFDSVNGPEITTTYDFTPVAVIQKLELQDYQPRGGTPLRWGLTAAIQATEAAMQPGDPAPLIHTQTDGEENTSPPEITQAAVKAMVAAKEAEGWVFGFMGAAIDAWSEGGNMGVAAGATLAYANSYSGTQTAWVTSGSATRVWTHGVTGQGVPVTAGNFYDNTDVTDTLSATDKENLIQYGTGTIIDPANPTIINTNVTGVVNTKPVSARAKRKPPTA